MDDRAAIGASAGPRSGPSGADDEHGQGIDVARPGHGAIEQGTGAELPEAQSFVGREVSGTRLE